MEVDECNADRDLSSVSDLFSCLEVSPSENGRATCMTALLTMETPTEEVSLVRCSCESVHHFTLRSHYFYLLSSKTSLMTIENRLTFSHLMANKKLNGTTYTPTIETIINKALALCEE